MRYLILITLIAVVLVGCSPIVRTAKTVHGISRARLARQIASAMDDVAPLAARTHPWGTLSNEGYRYMKAWDALEGIKFAT